MAASADACTYVTIIECGERSTISSSAFNTALYKIELQKIEEGLFPITLGGDHSIAISSALADAKKNDGHIGMIWIDAHTDYNTFESTITGNIHGLPLAAIDGYEKRFLTEFHDGNYFKPENTVIVGGRDIDPLEVENLKDAGVKVFTTEEIHEVKYNNLKFTK